MIKDSSYYDALAPGYDALYGQEQQQKLQESVSFLEQISLPKNATVLDVGCGTGISTRFYSQLGYSCTGIDPSKKLLEQNADPHIQLLCGHAEELAFENESFDLIISFSAIQNFSDVKKGLQEMNRVGKKYFILGIMNRGKDFSRIDEMVHSLFFVKETKTVLNDTLYLCEKK
ncbi:MAG: class I SAM-dependent methyltransferase [Candidatus Woesearchaeota archaeon]